MQSSNWSFNAVSDRMAYGEEGSMRILAVPIECHETESRIDGIVDNLEIQAVALGNRFPVMDAGAAQRIDPQPDPGVANRFHVDNVFQIADIRSQVVILVRSGGREGLPERHTLDAIERVREETIRAGFRIHDVIRSFRRTAMRGGCI